MRGLGWLGVLLVVAGAVVLLMGGMSYTKDRDEVNIGPLEVAAERKGFIPPAAGIAAIVIGGVLLLADRRRSA
jgi:hypothetical protein